MNLAAAKASINPFVESKNDELDLILRMYEFLTWNWNHVLKIFNIAVFGISFLDL